MNASPVDSLRETGGTAKVRRTPAGSACSRLEFHASAGRRRSRFGSFVYARRGAVAIESALAIMALMVVLAGLMAIAHTTYSDDRMGRAARAAARAVALVTDASATKAKLTEVACKAIKEELDLPDDFECNQTWVKVSADLKPSTLEAGTNGNGDAGDMVLVEIYWEPTVWQQAVKALKDDERPVATGVARREPAEA